MMTFEVEEKTRGKVVNLGKTRGNFRKEGRER